MKEKIMKSKPFKWLLKGLALFNMYEGVTHLAFAAIGIWGCFATNTWDWRVLAPAVENIVFGLLSLFTAFVLKKGFHH
jgi:hypothetical protein